MYSSRDYQVRTHSNPTHNITTQNINKNVHCDSEIYTGQIILKLVFLLPPQDVIRY